MKFDVNKVYTAVNADELKIGDKVYLGDSIAELKYKIENEDYYPLALTSISDPNDWDFWFATKNEPGNLAYLVERASEKK